MSQIIGNLINDESQVSSNVQDVGIQVTATLSDSDIQIEGTLSQSGIQIDGTLSSLGLRGYSAYELAVKNGFNGTEQEWLDSLKAKLETKYENGAVYYRFEGETTWRVLFVESDITVPSWAKQPQKPTYTYDEIQGTPPTVDLTGYATESYVKNTCKNATFDSYASAVEYATTSDTAYIGQDITVIDKESGIITVYVIANSRMDLSQVGNSVDVGNYENISNKPQVNGVTLTGNKTSSDLGIEVLSLSNSDIESILL